MATIDLGQGLSLHYYDLNSGGAPIVILLHGLGATGDSWRLQLPALLESGFRILAPDMRGFGKSSYPEGPNSPQIMAEDVANSLNRLKSNLSLCGGDIYGRHNCASICPRSPFNGGFAPSGQYIRQITSKKNLVLAILLNQILTDPGPWHTSSSSFCGEKTISLS